MSRLDYLLQLAPPAASSTEEPSEAPPCRMRPAIERGRPRAQGRSPGELLGDQFALLYRRALKLPLREMHKFFQRVGLVMDTAHREECDGDQHGH